MLSRFALTFVSAFLLLSASAAAGEDIAPPKVVGLSIEPASVNTSTSSQEVLVTAHLTDDVSGLRTATVFFSSPDDKQEVEAFFSQTNRISGTATDGIYQTTVTLPRYSETGPWPAQIETEDEALNHADYNAPELESKELPSKLTVGEESLTPPEWGRCAAVERQSGRFRNSACSQPVSRGGFEWDPTIGNSSVHMSTKRTTLTIGSSKVTCSSGSGAGRYVGTHLIAKLRLALANCAEKKQSCSSGGSATGEIVSSALATTPAWESQTRTSVVFDTHASGGSEQLFIFTCGLTHFELRGSLLSRAITGKPSSTQRIGWTASKGVQMPNEYVSSEGTTTHTYLEGCVSGTACLRATVKVKIALASEEPVELNSTV